ncbi:hypothetical protein [Castellaniella sp. UC4442_H9]
MQDIQYITWVNTSDGSAFTNPDHAGRKIGHVVNDHVVAFVGSHDAATRIAAAINAELPDADLTFSDLLKS